MTIQALFNAQELCAFIKALKWVQVPEALKDGLYVWNHPDSDSAQLVFAATEQFRDANETLLRAASDLAAFYNWPLPQTLSRIEEASSDINVTCVPDEEYRHTRSVPFLYAARVYEAQRKMLLAGAGANGPRKPYYSNTPTGNAKTLLETARFPHTEKGSFIFKVACPIHAIEGENLTLFDADEVEPPSFVRQAMLNIDLGLREVISSIQTRSEESLIKEIKNDTKSPVSSNLCRAVAELRDREHPHPVIISTRWSPLLPSPPDGSNQPIRIVTDYFPIFDDIAKELAPKKEAERASYIGTVEKLSGTFNQLFQREGTVVLQLLDPKVKVQVALDANQYDKAVEIHKTSTVVARVIGTIKSGQRQPYKFDLEKFEIINVQNF